MYDIAISSLDPAHISVRQLLRNVPSLPGPPEIRTDKHINLPINSRTPRYHLTSKPCSTHGIQEKYAG
jgi:hypothetical protein